MEPVREVKAQEREEDVKECQDAKGWGKGVREDPASDRAESVNVRNAARP